LPAYDAAGRTRRSFGLLWRETADGRVARHAGTHVRRAAGAAGVTLPAQAKRILDAGCGDGSDLIELATLHPQATVVGLDANDAIDVADRAVALFPRAHVVRGSVLAPPFQPRTFDVVYSYGVLHHTDAPDEAFAALARLVAPSGLLLTYVYTDLREEPVLRVALGFVSAARRVTTRLSPRQVLRLARIAAPVVFLVFAVPAAVLRRLPGGHGMADRLPFNFVRRPAGAVGDLYDRFSAPIEHRHSRDEVAGWYRHAGFEGVVVTAMADARGWVAVGRRPVSPAP
jgi:SAM-dependent methyltransferase